MAQLAVDRQIRPIYDALDIGSNKSAVQTCNKYLKKNPTSALVKSLKALAVIRLNKVEEALALSDEVLATKPTDLETLNAMMHVLRALGRYNDSVVMFDEAFKKQPTNEELGGQAFFANVRTGNWKAAQQVSTKMHRQFKDERYLYWIVISAFLQANDPATPPTTQKILLQLGHRFLSTTASLEPPHSTADRLYLHAMIRRYLGMYDEAADLLSHPDALSIVSTNLALKELQSSINRLWGAWIEEGKKAEARIRSGDRNWPEFLSVLDAVFYTITHSRSEKPSDEERNTCKARISDARALFEMICERDGYRDRSSWLALVDLAQRERLNGFATDAGQSEIQMKAMQTYLTNFSAKACCFEDLRPYCIDLQSREDALENFKAILDSIQKSAEESNPKSRISVSGLQSLINIEKFRRHILLPDALDQSLEESRAFECFDSYITGLPLGNSLPSTELQPADDFLLIGVQALVSAWHKSRDENLLVKAVIALEYGLTKSKHSYLMRLYLVRLYRLLAAPSLTHQHYRSLGIKSTQNDTLSHYLLTRITTFSLSAIGDLTYSQECIESSQIYATNSSDTSEFIVRAFSGEKYSQIPDFIDFEDRLDNSLQRDLIKIDHVRMRIAHEEMISEVVDAELIELKFIFDRIHHDNRDFDVMPNYQPLGQPTFNEQTLLFGTSSGLGYLSAYLRMYIRVFQQASDIDESLEEKLLFTDRQKVSDSLESKIPIRERLPERREEETKELTSEERVFFDFVMTLCDWLEPYHNAARPPPSSITVAAENGQHQTSVTLDKSTKGAKSSSSTSPSAKPVTTAVLSPPNPELKTLSPSASNGSLASSSSNGHAGITVTPPPEAVSTYFNDIAERFKKFAEGNYSLVELLHIVTTAQEAFIILSICGARFKHASVVKIHKFGALSQFMKELRSAGAKVLDEISKSLVRLSESVEGTREKRDSLMESSSGIEKMLQIDRDFVFGVVKKLTDARKRVAEGIGKGVKKISQRLV